VEIMETLGYRCVLVLVQRNMPFGLIVYSFLLSI
jgi:hypothetical protein